MQISEYQNIYLHENSHFIFVSTHKIVLYFLKKYLTNKKHLTILDAGCGTGLLISKMAKLGKIYGIDTNPEALKFCRKRHLKYISYSNILNTTFPVNFFDAITCIDVLYHKDVKNDLKALQEFYRILKPGGIFILKVPAYEWMRRKHDIIVQTRHRYTINELKQKIKKTHFITRRLTYANMLTLPLLIIIKFVEKLSSISETSDIKNLPVPLNKFFIFIQNLELQFMLKFNLPVGYSIYGVFQKPNS